MTALWRSRPLILASQSRTRQGLLAAAGVPFEVHATAIDERAIEAECVGAGAGASDVALRLARAKTFKVSAKMPDRMVIGADQVASLDGRLFGKVADRAAAKSQLEALSGRTHELHSGCCVARGAKILFETVSVARLACRPFSPDFVESYLAQADSFESAGTYRIEGLGIHLFDVIEGDYWTILGLPLLPILKFLREEGSLLA